MNTPHSEYEKDYLWGKLIPINTTAPLRQIYLPKILPSFVIGRLAGHNNCVLPGQKMGAQQSFIYWDRKEHDSIFVVRDVSENGTYINGERIGRNQLRRLRNGDTLSFAMASEDEKYGGREDYRYMFREVVLGSMKPALESEFHVQEFIAESSRSIIKKAIHKNTGRVFAVKCPKERPQARKYWQRYANEMVIMDHLNHPNICQRLKSEAITFIEGHDMMCLAVEYVEGGNLLNRITEQKGLSLALTKDIMFQICQAVSYMHSKGILHRDLKVTNILLTSDRNPIVKVTGFSCAGKMDTIIEGPAIGSPFYQAPELREVKERYTYNEKIDSWGIGVIVFFMLAGCHPFPDPDSLTRIHDKNCRRVDWTKFSGCVPQAVLNFMKALLEIDPIARISVHQALDHDFLQGYIPFNPISATASLV